MTRARRINKKVMRNILLFINNFIQNKTNMPEGPEVKFFVDDTKKHILGEQLISFYGIGDKDKCTDNVGELNKKLPSRVEKYFSKGKKVFMFLENNYVIIFSFGLTGCLVPESRVDTEDWIRYKQKYFRYGMKFFGNHMVYFSDVMSYGNVKITKIDEANEELEKLGPDFLTFNISMSEWKTIMEKKNVQKKTLADFFLDQQYVSGVGNKYRSEIMYRAMVDPLRLISSFDEDNIEKLYRSTNTILRLGYEDEHWNPAIYEKEKDKYGNEVKKLKYKGRTIYYCPSVQK